jgi:hypothetical protein
MMGVVLFIAMALLVAAAILYPMLTRSGAAAWAGGASDEQIEGAVRRLRRARSAGSSTVPLRGGTVPLRGGACPACGQAYQPGDRFCVRCGGALPQAATVAAAAPAPARPACRSCGAPLAEGDQFCVKCGEAV